jgi:hypothetical protein
MSHSRRGLNEETSAAGLEVEEVTVENRIAEMSVDELCTRGRRTGAPWFRADL